MFLINTFGVITTTNQQDYTLVKNAVEAAMNDSIDWASYRAGFYLCSEKINVEPESTDESENTDETESTDESENTDETESTDESESNAELKFDNKNEYTIILNSDLITHEGERITDTNVPDSKCSLLIGEYKLNKDVFVESFIRRFANNINNNKSYQVTIKEVIEYPPKVSVRIDTLNTYDEVESQTLEFNENADYSIRNQIDAILEEKG